MNLTKFKNILSRYSTEELKVTLGDKLVDMLIEWTPHDQAMFKKSTLADMIATIHGLSLLKDTSFRRGFLNHMSQDEILSLRAFLPQKYRDSLNFKEIIDYVADRTWRKDAVIDGFLSVLAVGEDVFQTPNTNETAVENLTAPDHFFELLDYQFIIKQRILHELTKGQQTRVLVQMPTGTGKTKTTIHTIIHHYHFHLQKQGLIIWLAHTTELLYQAFETFTQAWHHLGIGNVTTYKLWGPFHFPISDAPLSGFVFCGLQKLISIANHNPQLFSRLSADCRLIVVDEAHKSAAPETKKAINGLMRRTSSMPDRALIGLTATPGRNLDDSADMQRLVSMFDSNLIGIEPEVLNRVNLSEVKARNTKNEVDIIRYFQERRVLATINREELTYPEALSTQELNKLKVQATANGYDDYAKEFLETIGRNKSRNLAILDKLIRLNDANIPTIVFACSVEHGAILSAALTLRGIKNACVFGTMGPVMRRQAIQRFKDREDDLNILINYEVLTTGFDATNIGCVFITRPTQSVVLYSQMLGRGLRGPMMGGNPTCLLIDIADNLKKYNESSAFHYFKHYWNYESKTDR